MDPRTSWGSLDQTEAGYQSLPLILTSLLMIGISCSEGLEIVGRREKGIMCCFLSRVMFVS
jgi:hypothetical protein